MTIGSRAYCFLPGLILSLLGTGYAAYFLLNHDAASYLTFAGMFLDGARLYKDIIDTNTPLIIYLSVVPVLIHKVTGISSITAFFLFVFLLLQGCILFSWRLMRRHPLIADSSCATMLLTGWYAALFIMPNVKFDFGQREHLMCGLILPYICLLMLRLAKVPCGRGDQWAAGLFAGIGLSIKPHFVLIFIAAEMGFMAITRDRWVWKRIETFAIVAVSFLFYASIVLFTPDYIRWLPYHVINYQGYHATFQKVLVQSLVLFCIALPLLLAARRRPAVRPAMWLLFYLSVGSTVLCIVPLCDIHSFFYHALPLLFLEMLMATLVIMAYGDKRLLYVLLALCAVLTIQPEHIIRRIQFKDTVLAMAAVLSEHAGGEPVVFLSTSTAASFPAVTYAGTAWGLQMALLLHIPTAYMAYREQGGEPPYHTIATMPPAERVFHEIVIGDLLRYPRLIIIDNSFYKQGFPGMQFNFLRYYLQDPRFAGLWGHYSLMQVVGHFSVYRRQD